MSSFTDKLLQSRGEVAQSREAYVTQSVQDMVTEQLGILAKKRGFRVSKEQQEALDASIAQHAKTLVNVMPKHVMNDTVAAAYTSKIQELMAQTLGGNKSKQEEYDNGLKVLAEHVVTIKPEQVFAKGEALLTAQADKIRGTIIKVPTPQGMVTQFVIPDSSQKDFKKMVERDGFQESPFTSTESKLNAGVTLAIAAMSAVGAYSNFKHAVEPTMVEDGHGGATIENKVNWSNMTWGVVNTALAGAFAYMGTKSAKQSGLFR